MSAVVAIASTEGTEVALVAATAKTVIRVSSATNHAVKILGFGIYFDGVTLDAAAVQVALRKSTTAGTSTSVTPKRRQGPAVTIQTTSGKNFTVAPTLSDMLDIKEVHPTSGWEVLYPVGQEPILGSAERIGLWVTAPAAVNCEAYILFEE